MRRDEDCGPEAVECPGCNGRGCSYCFNGWTSERDADLLAEHLENEANLTSTGETK